MVGVGGESDGFAFGEDKGAVVVYCLVAVVRILRLGHWLFFQFVGV